MSRRSREVNRRPLQKIVGHEPVTVNGREVSGLWMDVLECGHKQPEKQDFMGVTNAIRRRCRSASPETSRSRRASARAPGSSS